MKSEVKWPDIVREQINYLPPEVLELFVHEIDRRVLSAPADRNGVTVESCVGSYSFFGWACFGCLDDGDDDFFYIRDARCFIV